MALSHSNTNELNQQVSTILYDAMQGSCEPIKLGEISCLEAEQW